MTSMEQVPQEQPQEQAPPPNMVRIRNMAQIALAQAAYPTLEGSAALKQWVMDGLSARFSDYFDNPVNTQELFGLKADNTKQLGALLDKIDPKRKIPESLH